MVRLARLGRALGNRFVFDAALGPREHEGELALLGASVFNGPSLEYTPHSLARRVGPGAVLTATWGEYLGDLGFDRAQRIREVVAWWRQVMVQRGIALLVADYAPLAQLAARSLGVPCVVTGQGYGLPPPELPSFPLLHPPASDRLHEEAQLLDNLNQVAVDCGLAPLAGLPEVYRADLALVHTFAFLDPYRDWRRRPHLPPVNDFSPVLADSGDELFVYFSTRELETPGVVEALAALPMPRRGYLLRPTPAIAQRLAASGMVLEPAPVPVAEIARRSRLLLHAGQHGMLSVGLLAGLPQVAVVQNLEQRFHAERAVEAGVARRLLHSECNATRLADEVQTLYDDAAARCTAQRLARSLRADMTDAPEALLAQALAPLREQVLAGAG